MEIGSINVSRNHLEILRKPREADQPARPHSKIEGHYKLRYEENGAETFARYDSDQDGVISGEEAKRSPEAYLPGAPRRFELARGADGGGVTREEAKIQREREEELYGRLRTGDAKDLRRLYHRIEHFAEDKLSPREMEKLKHLVDRYAKVDDPSREDAKKFYDHVLDFIKSNTGGLDKLSPRELEKLKHLVDRYAKVDDPSREDAKKFYDHVLDFIKSHAGDGPGKDPPLDVRKFYAHAEHFAKNHLTARESEYVKDMFRRFEGIEKPTPEQFQDFHKAVVDFMKQHAGDPRPALDTLA